MMSAELLQEILFYIYATVTIGAAMAVVSVQNTIYSALFLVLTFFSAAALWLLLEAEFLALTLVLIYVGAVMVLFLFVVMMLDIKKPEQAQLKKPYTQAALLVAAAMLVELLMLLLFRMKTDLPQDELIRHAQGHSNIAELGESLFTHYVYPFEIAGVILLVSIVAAIMLTHRKRPGNKHIDVSRQINVNPAERMRMVKMKTEKGNGEEQ